MMQNAGVSVGALLRNRREELGQDTETVSRQLRIRSIYLRAIEEGRIQDLPGATYAVGFVRSYADFLGFDGNSVVSSFRDELGQRGRAETVSWQIEDRDGGFPFGKILVVLLVIAAAGYGLWYYLANTQSGSGLIEAVPEYLKKSTTAEKPAASSPGEAPAGQAPASQSGSAAQPAGGATTDAQATGSTAPAATSGSPAATTDGQAPAGAGTTPPASSGDQEAENKATGQASSVAPANTAPATTVPATTAQPSAAPAAAAPTAGQATATQPAPEQPATSPTAQAAPAQTAAAPATTPAAAGTEAAPEVAAAANSTSTRVSIHAKLESWVQITDKDGKPVLSRVLRAGETYAVPDEKGLMMNTGNAGGIDLLVDGKALPSLGSVGLVKRNIVLDADKLTTGAVTTKAPETKTNGGTEAPAAPTGD